MIPLGWRIHRSRRSCCLPEAACTSELMSQGLFVSSYRLVLKSKLCCFLIARKKSRGAPRPPYQSKPFPTQQVAVIDSVESAQQAISELIAKKGPTTSLLHI